MALDVYLTNACNLHCRYCFNLDREDAPRVPLADIKVILKSAYDRQNRYVSITGGVNVGIGVTVSENNLDRVEEVLTLCRDRGIAFVRCVPVARIKKGTAAHITAALHERLLVSLIDFTIRNKEWIDFPPQQAG